MRSDFLLSLLDFVCLPAAKIALLGDASAQCAQRLSDRGWGLEEYSTSENDAPAKLLGAVLVLDGGANRRDAALLQRIRRDLAPGGLVIWETAEEEHTRAALIRAGFIDTGTVPLRSNDKKLLVCADPTEPAILDVLRRAIQRLNAPHPGAGENEQLRAAVSVLQIAAMHAELERARSKILTLEQQATSAHQVSLKISEMYESSISWRVTGPLREVRRIAHVATHSIFGRRGAIAQAVQEKPHASMTDDGKIVLRRLRALQASHA